MEYEVTIKETSKELSKRERIAIKDTKPSTTKVNFMLYKNIITTNTKEKFS